MHFDRIPALIFCVVVIFTASAGAATVGEAKLLTDGTVVTLNNKVVTAVFSTGYMYVEEPDRSSGIRLTSTYPAITTGDTVNVIGTLRTRKPDSVTSSEREIKPLSVVKNQARNPLRPVRLSCRDVGGTENLPFLPGVKDGVGLNNIGLFVRIDGAVTSLTDADFYLDDRSSIADIPGMTGVLVKCPTGLIPVAVGDFVAVTGIVEGDIPQGYGWTTNRRCVRMRDWSDLTVVKATTGFISGAIKDASGTAVAGASVTAGGYSATTGTDGKYTLSRVLPGSYSVSAVKSGYVTARQNGVNVTAGHTTTVDFSLTPSCIDGFITNGDFEKGFTSGKGNNWYLWRGNWSNTITYAEETTDRFAGSSCQRWGRSDNLRIQGGLVQAMPTTAGMTYEVIAWLRMDAADTTSWLEAGIDLTGQITNGEATSITYTKLETLGNRKWVRFRKMVKATGNSLSFFTKFGHYSQTTGPNWGYVDNVSIQPRIVLEGEDYVNAYDTTSGNTGGLYRSGDVDITSIPAGGCAVGWTDAGEWLEWTNVRSLGGEHVIAVNYAGWSDASVHLNLDGASFSSQTALPKSGWWDAYRRVILPGAYTIASGTHTVRLVIDTAGCNIDSLEMIPVSAATTLQAEDAFNFYDTTAGNSGGQYRTDDLDVANGSEGYYVGWTGAGEWLDFAVGGDARTYVALVRYASSVAGKANIQINGKGVTGSFNLPGTGGTQTWKSIVTEPFTLSTGLSTLRFNIETGGFNLNYITLIPIGDGGGGNALMTGVHFAGNPSGGIDDMVSPRGAGQWIYSTEVYANGNREPEDASFVANMTDYITSYLKPMYQSRIMPVVRIDYIWGETVPRLLSGDQIDTAAVDRYARTFKKFAQLADANGVPIRTFVVANEMNLKGEATGFTNGYIPEWYYAYVYDAVRRQVSTLGAGYDVLVGGMSPGSFTVDPIQTPPTSDQLYANLSTDALVYLENVVKELKRRGTPDVGFALHAYADFDSRQDYTISFFWTIRKQLEIIERSHDVVPYDQTTTVMVPGYGTAPVFITEWNRHTPQTSSQGRVWQETQTANFIRTAITRLARYNRSREVWDNVSNVYQTYDHRDVRHNFHPIKGICYFVFDTLGGAWGDYALKDWHTLSGSAEGDNDSYNAFQSMVGWRDPAGR